MSDQDNIEAQAPPQTTPQNGNVPPASAVDDPVAVLMRELSLTRSELEEIDMRLASIQVQLVLCGLLIVLAATVAVKIAKAREG